MKMLKIASIKCFWIQNFLEEHVPQVSCFRRMQYSKIPRVRTEPAHQTTPTWYHVHSGWSQGIISK